MLELKQVVTEGRAKEAAKKAKEEESKVASEEKAKEKKGYQSKIAKANLSLR